MEDSPGRGIVYDQNVDIKGTIYKISLFSPTRGVKIMARLTKLIGKPLSMMAGAGRSPDAIFELLPQAANALIERLDEDEVLGLIKDLLSSVTRDRKAIIFDQEFHGRLGVMALLVAKVVEVQFEDFIGALSDSFGGMGAAAPGAEVIQVSPSQTT